MNQYPPIERLRAWSGALPLLALLAGSYWLSLQVRPLPAAPDYKARHDPDYILENFSAATLGEQGGPRFLVAAGKMEHYPDNDATYLTEPRLTTPYRDKPPVHIRAESGEVSRGGDEIFLHDSVQVLREASGRSGEMRIDTSYLHVMPDKDLADTDRLVTITEPHSVTTAVGMKLDSKARTLKLLSRVRSQYDPAK